jgi:mannose-6-phosphate isomerase-like protein (cupin superfamily)
MAEESSGAFVLGPGEGRSIDLGNFAMVVKAGDNETGSTFSLLEATEPPGFGPPLHVHQDTNEAFYVLAGEYLVVLGDQEFACPAGSFIYVPAGVTHGFRVGNAPSRKLNLYTPAAMVGYFDELSAAIAGGDADDDRLAAIARRHGMQVVGSVPQGYL